MSDLDEPVVEVQDDEVRLQICACGRLADNFTARRWPTDRLYWSLDTTRNRSQMTREQLLDAFRKAWDSWCDPLAIEHELVDDPSQANVRIALGVVTRENGQPDGPSGTLAWAELSDGTLRPKQQLYDNAEAFVDSATPGNRVIDIVRVAAHEIGHTLGLVHDSVGSGALLEPTYSTRVRFPQSRDIMRCVQLGYKQRTTPRVPPSDPQPPKQPTPIDPKAVVNLTIQLSVEDINVALRQQGFKIVTND